MLFVGKTVKSSKGRLVGHGLSKCFAYVWSVSMFTLGLLTYDETTLKPCSWIIEDESARAPDIYWIAPTSLLQVIMEIHACRGDYESVQQCLVLQWVPKFWRNRLSF